MATYQKIEYLVGQHLLIRCRINKHSIMNYIFVLLVRNIKKTDCLFFCKTISYLQKLQCVCYNQPVQEVKNMPFGISEF